MEDKLKQFLNNKKAVRFASVMILFGITLHFLFIGLFEINLLEQVFSFGSITLNRLLSFLIGIGIAIVTYAAYKQDSEIVNTRLKELKEKVEKEARELKENNENLTKNENIVESNNLQIKNKENGSKGNKTS